jgi:DNA-binding NarL/FixJ family response regulator
VLPCGNCWARTEDPITPARILIADDHEAARSAIRSELHRRHNLKVCGEASNGEEAVQQARSLNPDLIILDVMMPIKGGFAAAEEIKKALPSIPILLISTGRDEEIVKQSKLAGVQGFISKFDLHSVLLKGTDALLRGETFFEDRDQSE